MARKSNWKRRGLNHAITLDDRIRARNKSERLRRFNQLPEELKQEIREKPELMNLI